MATLTRSKNSRSYNHQLQELADEYYRSTRKSAATTKEIAAWAIGTGRWTPPTNLVLKKCREDFSKALREQYIRGGRGQVVRAKHVVRKLVGEQQMHLWADIRSAPREHMEVAFQQRREQIVGDCNQLKRDVEHYNDLHPSNIPIQLEFNFTEDVDEGQFPSEYPRRKPK